MLHIVLKHIHGCPLQEFLLKMFCVYCPPQQWCEISTKNIFFFFFCLVVSTKKCFFYIKGTWWRDYFSYDYYNWKLPELDLQIIFSSLGNFCQIFTYQVMWEWLKLRINHIVNIQGMWPAICVLSLCQQISTTGIHRVVELFPRSDTIRCTTPCLDTSSVKHFPVFSRSSSWTTAIELEVIF